MIADLQKVELDRLVRGMVKNPEAGDKPWEAVQKATRAVTARANELAGRKFAVPEPDMKTLPQGTVAQNQIVYRGQRLLLDNPNARMVNVDGCVILCKGPTPRVTSLTNSIVVCDGDFTGSVRLDNCLLIVRGNVGPITAARSSIIVATGELQAVASSQDSFYQVSNKQLRFTGANNNVYVKSTAQVPGGDRTGKTLDVEKGPLQLIKFSDAKKKEETPKPEKK